MTLRARETPPAGTQACASSQSAAHQGPPLRRLQIPVCLESRERHAMHAGTRSTVLIRERPRTSRDVRRARVGAKDSEPVQAPVTSSSRQPSRALVTRFQVPPRSPADLWCALSSLSFDSFTTVKGEGPEGKNRQASALEAPACLSRVVYH